MSGFLSRLSIASIILSTLALFACSSDDGGGGGAAVPPNAVVINETNAKDIVSQATLGGVGLIDAIQTPLAIEAGQAPSASQIIELVLDKIKSISNSPELNIPVAEVFEFPCESGTSITVNATETATSASGTMTFNDCILSGVTLSGTIAFSASFNDSTGDWNITMSGNISATESTFTTTLSGLDLNQTGNDNTLEFSINRYTFSLDYTGGGGFLAQLLAAIVGNEAQACPDSPRSGVIQVTGADSTKAKGTINGDGTVTIEYDDGSGSFVEVPGSPFPCTDFFT